MALIISIFLFILSLITIDETLKQTQPYKKTVKIVRIHNMSQLILLLNKVVKHNRKKNEILG